MSDKAVVQEEEIMTTKQFHGTLQIFYVSNPEGEQEFYWIEAPGIGYTEEELNDIVETKQWHGPFASEQGARENIYQFAEDEECEALPARLRLSFQSDKSAPGKHVIHAVGDDRLIAVITVDCHNRSTLVQPAISGLPEWVTRQLADEALNFIRSCAT
jgi:hypothetical protein